jgi:hypothetical protein
LLTEQAGIGSVSKSKESFLLLWSNGFGQTEAIKGCLWSVMSSPDGDTVIIVTDDLLLDEAHDGLEEVVVEPHLVIEAIESQGLLDSVEPPVAEVGTYESTVLLLNEAVVVLHVRAAS